MAIWQDPRSTTERSGVVNAATVGVPRAARDAGLRSYMLSVYNYMASGVLLTGKSRTKVGRTLYLSKIRCARP